MQRNNLLNLERGTLLKVLATSKVKGPSLPGLFAIDDLEPIKQFVAGTVIFKFKLHHMKLRAAHNRISGIRKKPE